MNLVKFHEINEGMRITNGYQRSNPIFDTGTITEVHDDHCVVEWDYDRNVGTSTTYIRDNFDDEQFELISTTSANKFLELKDLLVGMRITNGYFFGNPHFDEGTVVSLNIDICSVLWDHGDLKKYTVDEVLEEAFERTAEAKHAGYVAKPDRGYAAFKTKVPAPNKDEEYAFFAKVDAGCCACGIVKSTCHYHG
jgi:hypothetical protein